jgi:hypothetical protein
MASMKGASERFMRFLQVVAVFASVSSLWAMPAAVGEEILLRQDLLDAVNNQREHEKQIVAASLKWRLPPKTTRILIMQKN